RRASGSCLRRARGRCRHGARVRLDLLAGRPDCAGADPVMTGSVQAALAEALVDQELPVVYWLGDGRRYVDARGRRDAMLVMPQSTDPRSSKTPRPGARSSARWS